MSTELAFLEAEALKLSPEDRVLLADHVLASLAQQDDVEEAWGVEIDRRLAEVEAGDVSLIPVERSIERARQYLSEIQAAAGASGCASGAARLNASSFAHAASIATMIGYSDSETPKRRALYT